MKKILLLLLAILTVSGCGGNSAEDKPSDASDKVQAAPVTNKKILVAYFSRTGEEYSVGHITKGNTAIVAELIAQKMDADLFEIKPATPYPDDYKACTELAKTELNTNARPALAANIDNLEQYDTVFIGYPIWWGAVPRVVMTFLESGDFSGKKIIPFCTHGGSGLANTEREIKDACPNSQVLEGLAIVGRIAQTDSNATETGVDAWLKTLGY